MVTAPDINFGVFYPVYAPTLVKVSHDLGSSKGVTITFPLTTGVTTYKLYGSLSPTSRAYIGTYSTSPINVKVPTSKIIVPEEAPYHFWVSKTVGSAETFIQEEPATVFTSNDKLADMFTNYSALPPCDYNKATIPYEMLAFYRDEIRRRHVSTLEIGGEEFWLFIKRLEGIPCDQCLEPTLGRRIDPGATPLDPTITTEQDNPRFQGRARCPICYGTGITGGYYFPISIKLGFLGFPSYKLTVTDRGTDVEKAPDSWTLWTPQVKQHDVLHRVATGERYVIEDVKASVWQSAVMRQSLKIDSLDADDMRVRITKASILAALAAYSIAETEIPLWLFPE